MSWGWSSPSSAWRCQPWWCAEGWSWSLCMEVTTSTCVTCVWICRNVFIFKRYAQICHFQIPINFVFSLDHITLLASSGQFQKHLNLYSSWRIEEALIVFIFLGQFRHNSQLIVAYWWCRGFQCIHDFSGTNSTASWDTIAPLYLYGTFFLWSCILCVHCTVCILVCVLTNDIWNDS